MKILIVGAMDSEIEYLKSILQNIKEEEHCNFKFYLGNIEIKILHTAGHSRGSVCYLIEDNLFSGDTLFYGTYGRTDLPTGNSHDMFKSLERIFMLSDNIKVYAGHGMDTSIGQERKRYIFK